MQIDISTITLEWVTETLLLIMQTTIFAFIFLVVERVRPIQIIQPFNKEKKAELLLLLVNGIIFQPFFYFILVLFFTHTAQELIPYQIFNTEIQSLPFFLQVFLGLLLMDLKIYIRHRFTHNFMWKTHAVHHSANDVNWLTGTRLHPSELFVDTAFTIPVMHLLGFSGDGIIYASMIVFLFNLFTHLNLNLEYPSFLRYIVGSPNFHRWHHAKLEKEAFNKNFSVMFPFIDIILGSFYHPKGKLPKEYGIYQRPNETPITQTLWGYLSYPFRSR